MDPVFAYLLRTLLALVFLSAAAHKLRAPRHFLGVLRAYDIAPDRLAPALAIVLVAAELFAGAGLLVPAAANVALVVAIVLLACYGAGIAINLLRGRRDVDCGCGAPSTRQRLSPSLVARNVALALAGLVALAPVTPRPLAALDVFTIAAGAAALYALYAAADLLIAYIPRTRALFR
jgi:hypothetical protein